MDIKFLKFITQIILDKKGFNVLVLDVKGISTATDFLIIAEGNVNKHVKAIADTILEEVKKKKKISPYRVDGRLHGDWVVLDYVECIVHIFVPKMREKYLLEKLWSKGKIIGVEK